MANGQWPMANGQWPMAETYIKVNREWKYLYRAVDRAGHTIDFVLRALRDLGAARCFLRRAIDLHGEPEKVTIDKSGANTAAIVGLCTASSVGIEVCQSKYLNNLIEQDHPTIKRVVRPGARVQVISLRSRHHRGHLDHAHDQEGATRFRQR